MLTKYLGIDIQAIYMTMLGLVGLYLVLKNSGAVNTLARTGLKGGLGGLIILQGRDPARIGTGL
jgi:hypothetical protein